MVIGLFTNAERDINNVATDTMISYLKTKNIKYIIVPNYVGDDVAEFEALAKQCDIVISFGGDGTVLRLAKGLTALGIPVMGVNLGNLGFLTELTVNNMCAAIDAIILGKYTIEERTVIRAECDGVDYYAINDVSLTRGISPHTVSIDINIDGRLSDKVKGDGVLVSSPLGSTAYSLSCGGPIISPELNALAILAICPHSLHSRPMVISDSSVVTLTGYNREGMLLSVDSNSYLMPQGDITLRISKAKLVAKFVRIHEENFYKKLINKLNYWNDLPKREY